MRRALIGTVAAAFLAGAAFLGNGSAKPAPCCWGWTFDSATNAVSTNGTTLFVNQGGTLVIDNTADEVVNGVLYLNNLPTSDPHRGGQLWNNGGLLAVSS